MPAKRTFTSARFRGPVQFDAGATNQGRPVPAFREYSAVVTQNGSDAPVATVLRNTLGGGVIWARADVGYYVGTLAGAFPVGKTQIMAQATSDDTSTVAITQ